jgi:hypothetical protein
MQAMGLPHVSCRIGVKGVGGRSFAEDEAKKDFPPGQKTLETQILWHFLEPK